MTLTELRYVVALAKEKHFGAAARACFVAQPTLSVAVRNLEEELGIQIFERKRSTVNVTAQGEAIIAQALVVLDQINQLKDIAKKSSDPLVGELKIGIIFTVAPHLLPKLMPLIAEKFPNLTPFLYEDYTENLLSMLQQGLIDCAITAQAFDTKSFANAFLYKESFWLALPKQHNLLKTGATKIDLQMLRNEKILLLNKRNCWHSQVLDILYKALPDEMHKPKINEIYGGSSLTTLLHMVAAGVGVSIVPATSVPAELRIAKKSQLLAKQKGNQLCFLPLQQQAYRSISLAWRRSFPQYKLMAELRNIVVNCGLEGVITNS